MVQVPVSGSYVPTDSTASRNRSVTGKKSVATTPSAASGPLFVTVTVKVTTSPTFGLALSTTLVTTRSATCGRISAEAVLFSVFGSNSAADSTAAVFVIVDAVVTRTMSSSVAVPAAGLVPTVHTPLAEEYTPWLGFDVTSASPAGSTSLIDTPVASSGPTFDTVIVNVTVSPTFGRGLSTDFATTKSACRGVIEALPVLLPVFGSN